MNSKATPPRPLSGTIRPTDEQARALARDLISDARFASLGVLDNGAPMVTRVAMGTTPSGEPLTLISDISNHTRALKINPVCSLLVGEPGPKGDPLTHPRLTLQCRVKFVPHSDPGYKAHADHYLATHPKAKLYIGFADFSFAIFGVITAYLNGGFGKAYNLGPGDLKQQGAP